MTITIPDETLAKLAKLIAAELSKLNDEKLGAFLRADPAETAEAPAPVAHKPEPEPEPEPTPEPEPLQEDQPEPITLEALRSRFQALSDKGLKPQLLDLLYRFDARTLPKVAEDRYPELVAELDQLEAA
jgi:hypothetical protein